MRMSLQANLISLLISVAIIPCAFCCYNSIFSFGNSVTDTGNYILSSSPGTTAHFLCPPYGETYFHHPTGRCCDGRLIIDFMAEFLGLPLIPAYLEIKDNQNVHKFQRGVNFAVVGATALDPAFLEAMGGETEMTNCSLNIQLDWFKEVLSSLCNTSSECSKLLSSSLISMGGIGGNDYNHALLVGDSIELVRTYVPLVVEAVGSAINELIEFGASTLLVPSNLPIGCFPPYLTFYETSDKNQYNSSTGCLNWLNKFVEDQNEQLLIELSRIQSLHPHVKIVYGDYYNAALQLYQSPEQFGFVGETTLKACCGGGGTYNYNSSMECGMPEASACENPAQFINWDGLHFTEAANRFMTDALLQGKYTVPPISTLCVSEA